MNPETAVFAVYLAIPAGLLWIAVAAYWFSERHPAAQEDAAAPVRALAESWSSPPPKAKSRFGIDDNETWRQMQMMRVLECRARAGGQDAGPEVVLRLEAADGSTWSLKQNVQQHNRIGLETLVPVGLDDKGTVKLATGQSAAELRGSVLAYRLARGLIDDRTHHVLTHGRPVTVAVRGIRPTGRLLAGHLELDLAVTLPDGADGRLVGFLRPREVTAVRQSGLAPACHDDNGQWVLGPTWY